MAASDEPDRVELMAWIKTLTRSGANSRESWHGERCMVDLWDLVRKYYYHPATGGSISIKRVLPAVLSDSPLLQARYSRPIYGSPGGIRSLNFSNWSWIQHRDGKVCDPYKLLPTVYRDLSVDQLDSVMCDDEMADGGAAMTAYAMMLSSRGSVYRIVF